VRYVINRPYDATSFPKAWHVLSLFMRKKNQKVFARVLNISCYVFKKEKMSTSENI